MEQGNRLKAEDFLHKVNALCGNTDCQEYTQLKAVIDGTGSYQRRVTLAGNTSSVGLARRFHVCHGDVSSTIHR